MLTMISLNLCVQKCVISVSLCRSSVSMLFREMPGSTAQRCSRTASGEGSLDNALDLIEGHPGEDSRVGRGLPGHPPHLKGYLVTSPGCSVRQHLPRSRPRSLHLLDLQ